MSDTQQLGNVPGTGIEIADVEQHPPTESVKLNGPPGTGKTTQLQERVVSLLGDGYSIGDICFVTYRKKMAMEFLRRLAAGSYVSQEQLNRPYEDEATRNFGTIHAVCNRISSSGDKDVASKSDKRDFFTSTYKTVFDGKSDLADSAAVRTNKKIGSLIFDAYDWAVTNEKESYSGHDTILEVETEYPSCPSFDEFSAAWESYKTKNGLMDYNEMLTNVRDRGLVPEAEILVVDEYHDMTPIMASICESWMETFETVIVGGDPLQAIYSYKGADPSFFTGQFIT